MTYTQTHFNIHEGGGAGGNHLPPPPPTHTHTLPPPCLRPPILERAKCPLFPSYPFFPIFPLSHLLFSHPSPSSPSSRTLTTPPSRPLISHLPLTLSTPSYSMLKYFFTCILFHYWWHKAEIILVLLYCIVNPTWGIWWFYCHRSYATEEIMYSFNQLKWQNFLS